MVQTSFLMTVVSLFGLYMINNHNTSYKPVGECCVDCKGCDPSWSPLPTAAPSVHAVPSVERGFLSLSQPLSPLQQLQPLPLNLIIPYENESWYNLLLETEAVIDEKAKPTAAEVTLSVVPFTIILSYIFMLFWVQHQIYINRA